MSAVIKSGSDRTIVNQDKQSGVLLYDASGDVLRYARCDTNGNQKIDIAAQSLSNLEVGTVDEVTNITSVDTVDQANLYTYNGTSWGKMLSEPATGAQIVLQQDEAQIHKGFGFFVTSYQDLSINQVLDFTWLMPNSTKRIHWTWQIDVESETNWLVYENATATNPLSTALTPRNSNRNNANTSDTTMKYEVQTNLAAANADTDVTGAILLKSGIAGAGKDAGIASRSTEMIMKANTLYCMRAIATVAGFVNFDMQWTEYVPVA